MKTAPRILIAALAAGLLASCAPSPQERMARAEKAMAEHRYSRARPDFLALLQDDPSNREVQLGLVQVHLAQEDPASALAILDDMARRGALSRDAALSRAEAYLMLGRFDDALAAVDGDTTAEAWRIRAIAHTGRNEPDQVQAAFASGLRAPGPRARLLADFAHFRMEQGDLSGGFAIALLGVKTDPSNLHALIASGDAAIAMKRHREALAWYSRAATIHPESRPALKGRIAALGELKQYDKARKLLAEARAAAPNDTDLLYFEARIAADTKDWEQARDLLQSWESSLETMPAANTLYAEALLRLGQEGQARTRLSSQLLREPENRKVRLLLGEAKLAEDDAEGALETLAPVADWADASKQELGLLAEARAKAAGD